MKKHKIYVYILLLLLFFCVCGLSSCYASREYQYYSDETNYISVTAELSHISYSNDQKSVYLCFSELPEIFSDNCFEIIGENWMVIQNAGMNEFSIGDTITFTTAPRYFGDGYIMPIVAMSIDGKVILDYEQGYYNFMNTYR